jgi:hypothetical protein
MLKEAASRMSRTWTSTKPESVDLLARIQALQFAMYPERVNEVDLS